MNARILPLCALGFLASCNMGGTDTSASPASTSTAERSPAPAASPPPAKAVEPATEPSAASTAAAGDPSPGSLTASHMVTAQHVIVARTNSITPRPADTLPLLTIGKAQLFLGTEPIAPVTPGPLGFEETLKRAGTRSALQVLPLDAALRPLREAAPLQSSIRILVDGTTSYRTALEVVFTATQRGFTTFDFVVYNPAVGERAIVVTTPTRKERDEAHAPGAVPPVSFLLRTDGVTISVAGEKVGPRCVKGATGTTVPLRDGKPDLTALAACATHLKELSPGWAGASVAEITAAPGLDMQLVLASVATVVRDYPVIHFGLLSG